MRRDEIEAVRLLRDSGYRVFRSLKRIQGNEAWFATKDVRGTYRVGHSPRNLAYRLLGVNLFDSPTQYAGRANLPYTSGTNSRSVPARVSVTPTDQTDTPQLALRPDQGYTVSPIDQTKDIWSWLGEEHRSKDWICKLVATAEDESLDWAKRNEAFERLASYREREAERVNTAPFHFDGELYAPTPGRLIFDKDEEGLRKAKKRGKQKDTRGAVKVTREGETDWGLLGNDEAAIRGFMERRAIDLGYNSLDHLAERKRGQQRLHLAMVVRDALGAGAKQAAIGRVIGRSKAVLSELAGLEA